MRAMRFVMLWCLLALVVPATFTQSGEPLPSWNDGPPKQSIVSFVKAVTTKGGKDFVPPEQRIATVDNDGTLWAEQPMYFQ